MCASCGCGIPEDDHGDPRNILFSALTGAAQAQGIAVNDVVNNLHAMTHESHKVDQKIDPEPIKDAKTKSVQSDLRKDWAEWDAERAMEALGHGRGVGRALQSRIKMGPGSHIHDALKRAGFRQHGGPRGVGPQYGHDSMESRTYMHKSGAHAHVMRDGEHVHIGFGHFSFKQGKHLDPGGANEKQFHSKDNSLKEVEAYAREIANRGHIETGYSHTHKKAHADIKKVFRGLGDEIADAILKGQKREEKGRFVPGKDDTHSHKMKNEIVTHTHDGEYGHTHPTREYGPSYHHR